MVDRYAVFGNPIAHSKSPRIHNLFAQQTGESVEYSALLSEPEEFAQDVMMFLVTGGKGCNVTVPFKQEAWELADELSAYAARAKAVNTLAFRDDGTLYGANTDGIGIVRDLQQNHGIALQGQRILLLGAGGAVRGVLQPLLEAHPFSLFIANRTAAKATELAQDFTEFARVAGGGFDEISGQFDLIINGTAASLQGDLPPLPAGCLAEGGSTYDMMYAAKPTAFVQWGRAQGAAKALDGLGMLVEQAAEAFFIWRGVRPDTAPILAQLRAELGG
ncbi:MAG TPA: shikimate dehydrogenase [Candidatus Thiothrix moscowensis]|uniref:shikimate dehydrogenase n=1 Tax=unclassified Thiothrix TaxID=2636184 RepID=UPI0025CBC6FD|nr:MULTISPECIES: shikimate dehydrogenase [unclassified Thiothrix]HRJ52000.1 shikimate dehydrogenase [Candidatus Thiothrix moscowensis]HRJ92489.1 shikimate dehydrogenase [Candidatus Thiothrix moscowensis]